MIERYPRFLIRQDHLFDNARKILALCEPYNVRITAVTKGFNSIPDCCRMLMDAGCFSIASSRLRQLIEVKIFDKTIPTMLIRIPMLSELADVVKWSDSVLVSEVQTLQHLNEEASRQRKRPLVILMRDVGDLREGFFSQEDLLRAALLIEYELPHLALYGIGTNLSCYGSIIPTKHNLEALAGCAQEIEVRIGRRLEIISGGATTSLPLLLRGEMPRNINHLRLGECLFAPPTAWEHDIDGLWRDVFQVEAEIVECNKKPTQPIGIKGKAAFGKIKQYTDRGVRHRAIVAIGNQDLGDSATVLKPLDPEIKVLGASGDHAILDIEDCQTPYHLGDIIPFNLLYQGCIYASMSPDVDKLIIR
jgi:predicted amino acid racemase